MLRLGIGRQYNKHPYSAIVVQGCPSADLAYLTRDDIERMSTDYSEFRYTITDMARKRAERFGYVCPGSSAIELGADSSEEEIMMGTGEQPVVAQPGPALRSVASSGRLPPLSPLDRQRTNGNSGVSEPLVGVSASAVDLAQELERMRQLVGQGLLQEEAFNQMSAKLAERLVATKLGMEVAATQAGARERRQRGSGRLTEIPTPHLLPKSQEPVITRLGPPAPPSKAPRETETQHGEADAQASRSVQGAAFFDQLKATEKPEKKPICGVIPRPTGGTARLVKACVSMATVIVITGFGNIVYAWLESGQEDRDMLEYRSKYENFTRHLNETLFDPSQFGELISKLENLGLSAPPSAALADDAKMWSFPNQDTFLFAFSVISTIGYGNIAPATVAIPPDTSWLSSLCLCLCCTRTCNVHVQLLLLILMHIPIHINICIVWSR